MSSNRSLFAGPVIGGLLLIGLLLCPGRPRRSWKIPWRIEPEEVVTTLGARISFLPFRIDPSMGQPRAFSWSVEGGPSGASVGEDGEMVAPAFPCAFTVVARNRQDGTVLKVPVHIWQSPRGSCQALPPMNHPRSAPVLVLLDTGDILVAGQVIPMGAPLDDPPPERFNPLSQTWLDLPRMSQSRSGHRLLALPGGRALVAGGVGQGRSPIKLLEVFEPGFDRFQEVGQTWEAYQEPALALLGDGAVLVTGAAPGVDLRYVHHGPVEAHAELLRWDTAVRQYQSTPLPVPPAAFQAALRLPSGRVFLVGTQASGCFDPATHRFGKPVPIGGRQAFDAGGGHVFVVGPGINPLFFRVVRVDAEAGTVMNTWQVLAAEDAGAVMLPDGRFLFAGGHDPIHDAAGVILFDPATGLRAELPSLPRARSAPRALIGLGGDALLVGGLLNGFASVPDVNCYRVESR